MSVAGEALPPASPRTRAVDTQHPWPGLEAFREADQEFFHGRKAEIAELIRLVLRERATLLFGRSGLGKTSLLQAGLFPTSRAKNLLPVYIRLDLSDESPSLRTQILTAITSSAEAASADAPRPREGDSLWEYFHREGAGFWSARNRPLTPLLVIDQFEEIFTLGGDRAREIDALVTELADLAEGRPPVEVKARLDDAPEKSREYRFGQHPYKILFSLREDFLPKLEGLRSQIRAIGHNRLRLQRMNGQRALEVVCVAGDLVSEDVAHRIIRFVAASEDPGKDADLRELQIEPALLSVVCRELNSRRIAHGEPRITADLLTGTRAEILADLYESSFEGLESEIRAFVEDHLLTPTGFRDSVALETALRRHGVTAGSLDRLVQRRLLRLEDHAGVRRIEVTHDLLTGVIAASRDRRRKREAREEAAAALQAEVARAAEEVREEAERTYQRKRLRFAYGSAAILGALTLVSALLGIYAWRQKERANRAGRLSEARLKTIAALNSLEVNPRQSLKLAREAVEATWTRDGFVTEEAESALHQALEKARARLHWVSPEIEDLENGLPVLSGDGRHLSLASREGVWCWELGSEPQSAFLLETGPVRELDLSADGRLLATQGEDDSVTIWDLASKSPVRRLELGLGPVSTFKFSPSGESLAVVGERAAGVFALSGERRFEIVDRESRVENVVFSPDRRYLAATNAGGSLTIRDAASGALIRRIRDKDHPVGRAVAFSPDGRWLATSSASESRKLYLWDLMSGKWSRNLIGSQTASQIAFTHEGVHLTTLSFDSADIWELHSHTKIVTLSSRGESGAPVALSGDAGRLLTRSGAQLLLWELVFNVMSALHLEEEVIAVQFDPESEHLVSLGKQGSATVWELASGRRSLEIAEIRAMAFHPRGRVLALADRSGEVSLWNVLAGRRIRGFPTSSDEVEALAFDPGGARIATGTAGGEIDLWSAETGAGGVRFQAHEGEVRALAFAPAGRLASAGEGGAVKLWDTSTGELIEALARSGEEVNALAFDPAGRRLAAAGADGLVRVWDLVAGGEAAVLQGHESDVSAVAFSPDGSRLASGGWDQQVIVWSLEHRQPVLRSTEHTDVVNALAFSPDGSLIASAGNDGVVRLRDLDLDRLLEIARIRGGIDAGS